MDVTKITDKELYELSGNENLSKIEKEKVKNEIIFRWIKMMRDQDFEVGDAVYHSYQQDGKNRIEHGIIISKTKDYVFVHFDEAKAVQIPLCKFNKPEIEYFHSMEEARERLSENAVGYC